MPTRHEYNTMVNTPLQVLAPSIAAGVEKYGRLYGGSRSRILHSVMDTALPFSLTNK
jgi:hypothetical protein